VPGKTGCDALCELQSGRAPIQEKKNRKKMNKGLLIIAVPALLVSAFWLTMGWGWQVAAMGAGVEISILAGVLIYGTKRQRAS
jgi:hypothetical protein